MTIKLSATGLMNFFSDLKRETCLGYLKEYFLGFEPRLDRGKPPRADSGTFFEVYSDLANPNIFDANDIAAVSCLSIEFRGGHVVSSLKHLEEDFKKLIADIPSRDEKIWDADKEVFAKDKPLWKLYDELSNLRGISTVTASKLLASKRPHLIPIQDKHVSALFGIDIEKTKGDPWWDPWWETMQSKEVRKWLSDIQKEAKVPGKSLLRIADVILWKHAQVLKGKK